MTPEFQFWHPGPGTRRVDPKFPAFHAEPPILLEKLGERFEGNPVPAGCAEAMHDRRPTGSWK